VSVPQAWGLDGLPLWRGTAGGAHGNEPFFPVYSLRKKTAYHQVYDYKKSPEGPLHSMPSKTIAYLRVSTGGQDLAHQKRALLEYARRHRTSVADFVEVHGAAGSLRSGSSYWD
jgi:hypothetical protein